MQKGSELTPPARRPLGALSLMAVLLLMVAAFLAGKHWRAAVPSPSVAPPDVPGLLWPPAPALTPFTLTAASGQPLTEKALSGRWTVIFFGYTHCPDICPVTLALLKGMKGLLRDADKPARDLDVLFVSLDAARDTPGILGRYVEHFDPAFRAATAPPEQLHLLTRQLAADFVKISTEEAGEYWFDHSAALYLVAPDLRVVGEFMPPHEPADLAGQIRQIITFLRAQP